MAKEKQVIEKTSRNRVPLERKMSDRQEASLPVYGESGLKRNKIFDFVALSNMGNLPLPIWRKAKIFISLD